MTPPGNAKQNPGGMTQHGVILGVTSPEGSRHSRTQALSHTHVYICPLQDGHARRPPPPRNEHADHGTHPDGQPPQPLTPEGDNGAEPPQSDPFQLAQGEPVSIGTASCRNRQPRGMGRRGGAPATTIRPRQRRPTRASAPQSRPRTHSRTTHVHFAVLGGRSRSRTRTTLRHFAKSRPDSDAHSRVPDAAQGFFPGGFPSSSSGTSGSLLPVPLGL